MLKAAIISMTISVFFTLTLLSIGMDVDQATIIFLIIYYGSLLTLKDVIE